MYKGRALNFAFQVSNNNDIETAGGVFKYYISILGGGVGGQSHLVLQCRGAQCTAMGGVGWEEKVDRSNNERRLSLSEDSG